MLRLKIFYRIALDTLPSMYGFICQILWKISCFQIKLDKQQGGKFTI